jgi:demethylmenaquinone methyltransferase/2-methoxy-6-polyprenyl-1,4-benzoquinol methylase
LNNIHDEQFVRSLFDEMSKTYGIVNVISSLGFAYIWRKVAVDLLPESSGRICDIMTGQGECLGHIARRYGRHTEVDVVDISTEMCVRAKRTRIRLGISKGEVFNCHAQEIPVPDNHYDGVVSTFGMKTLSDAHLKNLADELFRVIKPGGRMSILEFSIPSNPLIRFFFRIYVKYFVPLLGKIFLGNPDNYRLLWTYTDEFKSCQRLIPYFESAGFTVQYQSNFLGSATLIHGMPNKTLHPTAGNAPI